MSVVSLAKNGCLVSLPSKRAILLFYISLSNRNHFFSVSRKTTILRWYHALYYTRPSLQLTDFLTPVGKPARVPLYLANFGAATKHLWGTSCLENGKFKSRVLRIMHSEDLSHCRKYVCNAFPWWTAKLHVSLFVGSLSYYHCNDMSR